MEKPEETVAIDEPMAVEAGDRDVRISIAQDGVLTPTAGASSTAYQAGLRHAF